MYKNKQYYNISEVSKILNLKEHVIRHWDSVNPKTNKLRIEGLSIRTKGGTRDFNQTHIKKLIYIIVEQMLLILMKKLKRMNGVGLGMLKTNYHKIGERILYHVMIV